MNRELREAQQQIEKARTEDERTAAMGRAATASRQLLQQVKSSSYLIRVDLASGRPVLASPGPYQLPGSSGALLFEVVAGGEGLSFSTAVCDLSQADGLAVCLDVSASGTTYVLAGFEHLPTGRTSLGFEFR